MIIKVWILLAALAVFLQIFLAGKKAPRYVGLFIPAVFLAFAVYAWHDLAAVGIAISVLVSFMIPPIFLLCVFELFYWRRCWKERM